MVVLNQVFDANGDMEVGKISKQWSGFVQEYFTDADNFGVNCNYLYDSWHAHNMFSTGWTKINVTQTHFFFVLIKRFKTIQWLFSLQFWHTQK